MSKFIIINHLVQEIRVAVKEDKRLSEIYYERKKDKSPVGNIYKGKVLKVLPGMGAAFVDIGLSKAAFLYVDDIRTDETENTDLPDNEQTDGDNIPDDDPSDKPAKHSSDAGKHLNIADLLKRGQDVIVQVTKGQIGMKGARIICRLSIPGRNIVLIPYYDNVAVSKQIFNHKERHRLKNIINRYRPENVGFIIRTVAQRKQEDEFIADIEYLKEYWEEIQRKTRELRAPALLYEELNLTRRVMREFLSSDVESIVIDNLKEYEHLQSYLKRYLPRFADRLHFYDEKESIFDFYDINVQIDRALGRKVMLRSGGHLIIDQAEALTAIDINTGSFIGTDNHEETILKTNLEATVELANQLKLRDIGGIIIIDYIDMEMEDNRKKVYTKLKLELKRDKARSKISTISELGLVEMTRKRSQESLSQYLCMVCPVCDGLGEIKSIDTIVYDILRDVYEYSVINPTVRNYLIKVHPDVKFQFETESYQELKRLERTCGCTVYFATGHFSVHEQYEILELEKSDAVHSGR